MRYQISQKLFTFGDDFSIKDSHGKSCYYVDGHAFSLAKKLSFQDNQKKELALISRKLFTYTPTYKIKNKTGVVATIRKKLMSMRPSFIIDVPGPNDYTVIGDFFGHEYSIYRDGKQVARVSKKLFSYSDSYGVDITGGNALLILSAVVVIDLILYNKKS